MPNRENSAKIFISSTAQQTLQPLRQKLKEILVASGHRALLFEENFGLWSENTLMNCLRKVSESDVYVLFISNESGSFTGIDSNITATYAEYLKALEEQEIIIPFVETHILDMFREHIKIPLERKIQDYIEKFDREPDYTYNVVKEMVEEVQSGTVLFDKLNNSHIHPFQWAFIHDVYTKQWTYSAPLAQTEESCQFIIEALSQILKTLAPYYPLMNHINEAISTADRLTEYKKSIPQFMQFLRGGEIDIKNTLYLILGKTEFPI